MRMTKIVALMIAAVARQPMLALSRVAVIGTMRPAMPAPVSARPIARPSRAENQREMSTFVHVMQPRIAAPSTPAAMQYVTRSWTKYSEAIARPVTVMLVSITRLSPKRSTMWPRKKQMIAPAPNLKVENSVTCPRPQAMSSMIGP